MTGKMEVDETMGIRLSVTGNYLLDGRAVVILNFLLLATIGNQVSADLANDTAVLIAVRAEFGNPQELPWLPTIATCEWAYVECDALNTTVIGLNVSAVTLDSPIPTRITELTNLVTLRFTSCALTGTTPPSIASLSKLEILDLSRNFITGNLPVELGNLTSLKSIKLNNNNLTGTLPELAGLQNLQSLTLSANSLINGSLPRWLGNLPNLVQLNLESMAFEGEIPTELGKLTNLSTLNLKANYFSGPLAPELGNLAALETLDLTYNLLNGSIPDSFKKLQNLSILSLAQNEFSGSIPSWLADLSSLTEIDLRINHFSGEIPATLGNKVSLTNIYLSSNNLSGVIPESFSNLTNLLALDLRSNSLVGPVPESILSLPSLGVLYLDNNCFNGTTPQNPGNLVELTSSGGNCFSDGPAQSCKCVSSQISPITQPEEILSSSSSSNQKIYIAVGVAVGSLLAFAVLFLIFWRCKRTRKKTSIKASVKYYQLSEVRDATKNFTTKIGQGGQATVYKAEFKNGTVAAVKRFGHDRRESKRRQALTSFELEVQLLGRLNHRNLVNLTGYCEESGERLLMFEFMDRGSLYEHLHATNTVEKPLLSWADRVVILICVAYGIEYLHYGSDPPVMHRDIKSANILLLSLGDTLIAKVADFGLGKVTTIDPENFDIDFHGGPPKAEPTIIMGTRGYMDPDFLKTAVYSPLSDIYSYGVVLLELITGRKATYNRNSNNNQQEQPTTLAAWVRPYLDEPEGLPDIVDPKLKGEYAFEELVEVAKLARRCIEEDSTSRPTIRDILQVLREVFKKETRLINPSIPRTDNSSTVEFSGLQANLSADFGNHSGNSYTISEILPRD